MTTHLARYFHVRRLEKGLRLGQVARMLGYRNLTKGSRLVQTFERTGKIDTLLLEKLAVVLEITKKTQNDLLFEDYKEWYAGKNRSVAPYLLRRMYRGTGEPIPVPDEMQTVEEMEGFAAEVARRCGLETCLILSERITIWFFPDGSLKEIIETVPSGEA
jgi:hypothetical protein